MSEITTKNITSAMQTFASENLTPLSECDFEINSISTYIKDNTNSEFMLFNKDINEHYKDKEKILNEHVEFQQFFSITPNKVLTSKLRLNYHIDYGIYSSHPKIILHPNSEIPYKEFKPKETFTMLLKEFNKIKALNGILIKLFDEDMVEKLKALTKYLYAGKFVKKIRIPLFNGIEPLITRESKLIYWFEDNSLNNQVIEVDAKEVLIEFKKPIYGKNGFNAYGQIIDSEYANNKEDLSLELDTSIDVFEDETKKLYKSKTKGFVHVINNKLIVDNKMRKARLSPNEDNVVEEEENNIEVHISQNDTNKDSVREGAELVSETVHITGHIGANSIIEAINLQIDGVTHEDSTQFSRFANINRHKGTLRCHDAKIGLLEGGEVHATNVEIESSLGGSIYAQNVKIGHVKSNLKVYASESISIKLVSGEDNLFQINYKEIPVLLSKLDLIDEDIEDIKFKLEEATRHNKTQIPLIKDKMQLLINSKDKIVNSALSAKISIKQPLKGLNKIIFTINDEDELIFKTDSQAYKPFHLEVTESKITLIPTNKTISLES